MRSVEFQAAQGQNRERVSRSKIAELKSMSSTDQAVSIDEEVNRLSARAEEALVEI